MPYSNLTNNMFAQKGEKVDSENPKVQSWCGKITNAKLIEMKSMLKLKALNYSKPWDPNNHEELKKNLPKLTNNNPKEKWKHQSWRAIMSKES